MPTYAYLCGSCGARVEFFQSISESPKRKCPECGRLKLARQIGAGAGILFKGRGFYQTDYRTDSYREGAKADAPASTGKEAGSADGKAADAKQPEDSGGSKASKAPKSKDSKDSKDSGGG